MKISNQNQLKDFFQKRLEILKLKMKEMKLKNGKKKIKQKDLIYKTNTYNINFNIIKQQDLLVKVFILLKYIYTKLKWIKVICKRI